ncbi:MAG: arylesterase [Proteobacteria bacterium]|nr:arylesterase [Pseudomonadota bacterium]
MGFRAKTALIAILLPLLLLFNTGQAGAADHLRLLVFGDSLVAGYGLPAAHAFPVRLQMALRKEGFSVTVINGGVSGDTTTGGRSRLAWMLSEKPHAAILELGANDGLRAVDPAVTRANIDAMLAEFKARGVKVLMAGMLAPPNLGREYSAEYNSIFPDMARKHDVAFYPFFLDGVVADPALNQPDGIHPNAAGVDVIVQRILPSVIKLLKSVK